MKLVVCDTAANSGMSAQVHQPTARGHAKWGAQLGSRGAVAPQREGLIVNDEILELLPPRPW